MHWQQRRLRAAAWVWPWSRSSCARLTARLAWCCVFTLKAAGFLFLSWFFHLIPRPCTCKAPNSSSLYLPASTQQGSPCLATPDIIDLNLVSSQVDPERIWRMICKKRKKVFSSSLWCSYPTVSLNFLLPLVFSNKVPRIQPTVQWTDLWLVQKVHLEDYPVIGCSFSPRRPLRLWRICVYSL